MSLPTYGQRSDPRAAPDCPRHPGVRSVDYCKRCNRPMCTACVVPTEVRNICVDCASANRGRRWAQSVRSARAGGVSITYGLIIACVIMYLVTLVAPRADSSLMLVPAAVGIRPWTILTSAFLHGGFLHIAFNMLSLYWVGRAIESVLGAWRYLSIYLVSALGGSAFVIAWCLVQPSHLWTATVGASGAVFGLFGAIFVLQRFSGRDTTAIVTLLVVNLLYGFMVSGISWQAHLGGMIAGAAATWVLMRLGRARPGITERAQNRRSVLAAIGMVAAMVAVNALAFRLLVEVFGA